MWDLPTRLFHWLLVALVAVSFATGKIGGNAMQLPRAERRYDPGAAPVPRWRGGSSAATRRAFRTFWRGRLRCLRYAADDFCGATPDHHLSHNPLGGWSVAAMLLALLVQARYRSFRQRRHRHRGPALQVGEQGAPATG
ncbi:MAG: hypothetical protein MZV70_71230 [Desulfobacterales bacterium]|nr:hypothetical protein [Desulfobacterales bacterium]